LATYPALLIFKGKNQGFYLKWTLIYAVPGVLLLLIPLWMRPSIVVFALAMIPFFLINIYFSWKKNDRAFLNDLSAIIVFSIAGLASAYLYEGSLHSEAWLIFAASVLFFTGTIFFVKTMIRERKNVVYKRLSWAYHALLPLPWLIAKYFIAAIAFLPNVIAAFYLYGKPWTPKQIGILLIINSVLFFICMALQIKI